MGVESETYGSVHNLTVQLVRVDELPGLSGNDFHPPGELPLPPYGACDLGSTFLITR